MKLGEGLSRAAREPIVWFLILGTLVFVLDRATSNQEQLEILVDQPIQNRLSASWQASYGRPPSQDELSGLIEDHIIEEMLYREAIELGLDQDDQIVRRRLAQKTRFLHEDSSPLPEIRQETLREWFEPRRAAYQRPALLRFRHVYINPELRGAQTQERLDQVGAALQEDASEKPQGDLFLLPSAFTDVSLTQVANQFGDAFASSLDESPLGRWSGPIESSYGLHFVRIEARVPAFTPSFEELALEIEQDYAEVLRRQANEAYIASLRNKYRVEVRDSVHALTEPASDP